MTVTCGGLYVRCPANFLILGTVAMRGLACIEESAVKWLQSARRGAIAIGWHPSIRCNVHYYILKADVGFYFFKSKKKNSKKKKSD